MSFLPETKQQWIAATSFYLFHSILDYCLGKTTRVKANSHFELIEHIAIGLVMGIVLVFKKEKKDDKSI